MAEDIETDPSIKIDYIYGACPVQAEGTIDGKEFYFRARWDSWSIGIGGDAVMCPEWSYMESYGDSPGAAGWMPKYEAIAFIAKAVKLYTERAHNHTDGG